jgi:hypothetical protein
MTISVIIAGPPVPTNIVKYLAGGMTEKYEKFLIETLSFPETNSPAEPPAEGESLSAAASRLAQLPHRPGR